VGVRLWIHQLLPAQAFLSVCACVICHISCYVPVLYVIILFVVKFALSQCYILLCACFIYIIQVLHHILCYVPVLYVMIYLVICLFYMSFTLLRARVICHIFCYVPILYVIYIVMCLCHISYNYGTLYVPVLHRYQLYILCGYNTVVTLTSCLYSSGCLAAPCGCTTWYGFCSQQPLHGSTKTSNTIGLLESRPLQWTYSPGRDVPSLD